MDFKTEILLSTHEGRIWNVLDRVRKWSKVSNVLIVHQTNDTNLANRVCEQVSKIENVRYLNQQESGVSKSRNLALQHSSSSILLFCDDDIELVDDFHERLESYFKSDPLSAAITFAVKDPISGRLTKKFPDKCRRHNKKTILGVGTIEIAVRRDMVFESGVFFPEELGAGAEYPLCDEPVFLSRLLDKNYRITYEPVVIALHPTDSSGRYIDTYQKVKSRYIAFDYIFGKFIGKLLFLLFAMKNYKRIEKVSWVARCFVSK